MQPKVSAICLTANRPEMTARAVRCFEAQAYERKRLIIYDTSAGAMTRYRGHFQHCVVGGSGISVGSLRNEANRFSDEGDILIHWDSDDYSAPQRISEQVEHLASSGADAVGYSDLLFWRETTPVVELSYLDGDRVVRRGLGLRDGESWLYSSVPNSCPGTSLCYWRRTWERKPFPNQPRPGFADGEDVSWVRYLNLKTVSSFGVDALVLGDAGGVVRTPRLIASVHGRNTSGSYKRIGDLDNNFKRVPEWDDYCRVVMSMDRGEQFSGNPAGEAGGHQVDAGGNRPSSQDE